MRTLGRHDYFGERALLHDERRTATVAANSAEVDLLVVDKDVFLQIVKVQPAPQTLNPKP